MNPKTFSILTAFISLFAMALIALPTLTGTNASARNGKLVEKSIALPTGVTLSYVEHGNSKGIPLILLHGFTDSWRSYEYVLDKFPENFHVIAISQRGHGNSTKTARTDHTKYFAADIAEFIEEKGLGSCVIVGHSLGGLITQQFALDYPQLTRAIVIMSSEPSFADNAGIPEFVSELRKLNDPVDPKFAEAFQWSTIVKPVDSATVNKFIVESMKVPAQVWRSVADLLMKTDFSNTLQKIHAPTLILWGDKDSICFREGQEQFTREIHDSRLLIYKDTGHAPHWEDGNRVVKDITAFVSALE